MNLDGVSKHAGQFKVLQDRFRQAWGVTAMGPFEDFMKEFDDLMGRLDAARATAPTAPEKFFEKARRKIEAGDYGFAVDKPEKPKQAA